MTLRAHQSTVAAAAAGDDDALTELVRLHHDRIYRFGRRVCRDAADTEDAVQHAFERLAARPDVVQDRGALSWLFSVVRNACLGFVRSLKRERRTLGERLDTDHVPERLASAAPNPELALERWQLVRAVHQAIAELDAAHREVLVFRDLEGLSGPETAAALGLSTAAMKSRLHRARLMLRAGLEKHVVANTPRAPSRGESKPRAALEARDA